MVIETRYKHVNESRRFQFNFSEAEEVVAGDPISLIAVTKSPVSSPDLAIGGTATNGAYAQVLVSAGKAGTRYAVTCQVTLVSGAILIRAGYIEVTGTLLA